jgi:hypothetical protein
MWEIEKGVATTLQSEAGSLILEGNYVKGLSGMACVLPAWTILEVLKMPKLIELRRDHTKNVIEPQLKRDGLVPTPEVKGATGAAVPDGDANPNHLADFTRLVDVAARKRPQDDQT